MAIMNNFEDDEEKKAVPGAQNLVQSTAPTAPGAGGGGGGGAPAKTKSSSGFVGVDKYIGARSADQLKGFASNVAGGLEAGVESNLGQLKQDTNAYSRRQQAEHANDYTKDKGITDANLGLVAAQMQGGGPSANQREQFRSGYINKIQDANANIAATTTNTGRVNALRALAKREGVAEMTAGGAALGGSLLGKPQESRDVFSALRQHTISKGQNAINNANQQAAQAQQERIQSFDTARQNAQSWYEREQEGVRNELAAAQARANAFDPNAFQSDFSKAFSDSNLDFTGAEQVGFLTPEQQVYKDAEKVARANYKGTGLSGNEDVFSKIVALNALASRTGQTGVVAPGVTSGANSNINAAQMRSIINAARNRFDSEQEKPPAPHRKKLNGRGTRDLDEA